MNLFVILGVIAAMVALWFVKLNAVMWLIVWWIGLYVVFNYGVDPPLPVSIIGMFMFIVTLALLAFMSADSERMRSVRESIVSFMVQKAYRIPLVLVRVPVWESRTPKPFGLARSVS